MDGEMVSEISGFCSQLTRLVAREQFIEFSPVEALSLINQLIFEMVKCFLGGAD
jgi:hypothetical protein